MAFNPVDFLKNLVPDDANMFGASPNANMKKMAEMGLLGDANYEDMLAKANKQSVFQGLLNTGLAYAAQPKNQGYGSIFPYLAKAGLAGVQAAQSPFDRMGKDAMMNQQLEEMKRAKDIQGAKDLFRKNYPLTGGTTQIDPNQEVPLAPFRTGTLQDDTIGSSLMTGEQYNQPRINGMPIPNEVAPMFDVINTSPMDALNRGVSQDQLSTTKIAPDSELVRAEQAYKAGVLNYGGLVTEKARIAESEKPVISSINPEYDVYRDGELFKSGVKKDNLTTLQKEYEQAKLEGYKGTILQFKKEFVPSTTVTVNGTETLFQTQAGNDVVKLRNNAQLAEYNIPKIDTALKMLYKDISRVDGKQVYTGAAADLKIELGRAKDFILNARKSNEKVTNTQLLDMMYNSDVFPLIKSLGIGARGMDTPAERQFLIESMVGSTAMTPEALMQATLTRRARIMNEAKLFNKNFDSQSFTQARKAGVTGLDVQFNEKFMRGPVIRDVFNPKFKDLNGDNIPLQEYADGTIINTVTGKIIYNPKNPYGRQG